MNFIFIAGVLDKIGDTLKGFFFGILLLINAVVYSLVSLIYQIFLAITQSGSILNNDIVTGVVNRLYIILSVVILFIVAYSLLKNMINPDEALKGKKSPVTIIRDVVISVVLIALVPTIFDFAFSFQNAILEYNTIGKIIAGSPTDSSKMDTTIRDGGYEMASGVWQAFIYPNDPYCKNQSQEANGGCEVLKINGVNYGTLWENARTNTTFWELLDIQPYILDGTITYLFPFDLIAGVFVLLVLLSYCLDMAVRLVKLSVFELIAPIPIMARIIPDEKVSKVFNNWLKATLSTFAEVFIRIAILYFAVIIITEVGASFSDAIGNAFTGGGVSLVKMIAKALIIIGIILFVKQAPGIIKDITGLDGSKYNVLGSALKAASAIGATATVGARNFNNARKTYEDDPNKGKFRNTFNKYRNALGSSLAGGVSGAFRSSWNRDNIKDWNSMKTTSKNATENAIKKRIQRENDKKAEKLEREQYIEQLNEERRNEGKKEIKRGTFRYKAHKAGEDMKEWAGAGDYNAVAVQRTKEMADRVDSNFGALEGTWKKTQAFIDAKAEAEKLKNDLAFYQQQYKYDTEYASIAASKGYDIKKLTDEQREELQKDTITAIKTKHGFDLQPYFTNYDQAKFNQDAIERSEQKKKAETIATSLRNIQLTASQYSDIKIDTQTVLDREDDVAKRARMELAFKEYGNLDDEKTFNQFIKDLKNDDKTTYEKAHALIDFYDKYNLQAKFQKGQAAYQEEQRKSTTAGKPKDGAK